MSAKPSNYGQKWPTDLVDQVAQRWRQGDSAAAIAAALGVSRGQISGLVSRHKIERPAKIKAEVEARQAAHLARIQPNRRGAAP